MSTRTEILDVHSAETKFKLKPHLASSTLSFTVETKGPLRVSLAELFTEETLQKLREMKLL